MVSELTVIWKYRLMGIEWRKLHLEYDPLKAGIGKWIRRSTLSRRLFFVMLDRLFLREWYVKRELRGIAAASQGVNDILDAGSGYGQYSYFCTKHFPNANVLGVDVKQDQINDSQYFCGKLGLSKCRFEVADLQEEAYESQFDLVISVDVMEHIPDDVAVFRSFCRSLRSGGLCVIHTPLRKHDSAGRDGDHQVESVVAEHVREGYTLEEISDKLSEAGLVVDKLIFTYGKYGAKAWRLLQGHPMRWIHKTKLVVPLLPIYYLIVYPVGCYWMHRDMMDDNPQGGGVLVVASKPRD
jgi:SAM-dependent methyltransferase